MKILLKPETKIRLKKSNILCLLVILFLFSIVTLFIDFLHTETTLSSKEFCPACNFHNSSITTGKFNFLSLPSLVFIKVLKIFDFFNYNQEYIVNPSSRSPPINIPSN
ncbi:hypothetical protein NLC36_02195 [Candidatus Aminicenantes bacterium AC-335-L06]|nr:hypothetical protein [Candidatus Aminicenantes bacterium AC-335-L06]